MSSKNKSLLAGGLISSAGILISKILGLIYVIPYNEILGSSANSAYYATAYNIYSYILNIAVAGLPFAISTLVARYATRKDYKMCLLVKKVSLYMMATLGTLCCLLMIVFSKGLSKQFVPDGCDVSVMKNVIVIISFAVLVIPILSSIRGFFNGIKEMEIYSMSQVVEQIVRILFLLSIGAIAVYIFNMDRVWAVYFGVFAASVAGITTYFFVKKKGRVKEKEIEQLAKQQTESADVPANLILKELIIIAIPFLFNAMFGYCDTIINMFQLKPGMAVYGNMKYNATLSSAIFYKATKIIAIPMILAPGFSAAIIPHITSAIEEGNTKLIKRNILDCVESVLYIALPICLGLCLFSREIMIVLFGSSGTTLAVDSFVLKWYALEGFSATVAPIFASIGMALEERKKMVYITFIFSVVKLIINYPLVCFFGVGGMVLSSAIAYSVFAYLIIRVINGKYKIQWKYTFRKLIFMITGLVGFYMIYLMADIMHILDFSSSRFVLLFVLAIVGGLALCVYFVITAIFRVPQTVFKIDLSKLRGKKNATR